MDGNDVRVIESRRSSGFLDKPLLAVCAGWLAGGQNLYCDKAVQAYVTGLVNLSHPGYCDGSQDLVGAELSPAARPLVLNVLPQGLAQFLINGEIVLVNQLEVTGMRQTPRLNATQCLNRAVAIKVLLLTTAASS